MNFFEEFKLQKNSICASNVFGASWNDIWAVNVSFSLPEWQAVQNDFLCTLKTYHQKINWHLSWRLAINGGVRVANMYLVYAVEKRISSWWLTNQLIGRCKRESNYSENFLTRTSFWTRTCTHIHVVETYWFLLERIGEMTSASVHLLLKGAVPVGVSPGEQPVYNKNVFNNKAKWYYYECSWLWSCWKTKIVSHYSSLKINSIQVFICRCNNTYLPLDFLPKWMIWCQNSKQRLKKIICNCQLNKL